MFNEFKNIKSSERELRSFGLMVGAIFAALGFLFLLMGSENQNTLLLVGAALLFLGVLIPRALYWPYRIWMGFALIMGWIMSRVILTVLFFFVFTTIGLIARIVGKDFLGLKNNKNASSYWQKREGETLKEQYEKQF